MSSDLVYSIVEVVAIAIVIVSIASCAATVSKEITKREEIPYKYGECNGQNE